MFRAFRVLLPFLKPYRPLLLVVLVSVIVVTLAGLLAPWLIRSLVGTLRVAQGDPSAALPGVGQIALLLFIAYGLRSVGHFLNNYVSHIVAWNLVHDLRVAVYDHLQRFSPKYYSDRQSGEVVSRVIKDTEMIEPLVADAVYNFAVGALIAIGSLFVLLSLSPGLTLLAFLPMPVAIGIMLWMSTLTIPAWDDELHHSGEMSAMVQDKVAGMKEVQVFNRERESWFQVNALSKAYAQVQVYARKLIAYELPLVESATGLSIVLVVLFGTERVLDGTLRVEDLVAFVLYINVFYQPMQLVVGVTEVAQRALAALRRIDMVLTMEPDVIDAPDAVDPGRVNGRIELRDVTFAYEPDPPVLHDINLTIAPGQTLALVGPTGAGKSTLISLIARFYDPQQGQLLIDGVDARDLQLGALRRNISMVLQDVYLFNDTARENIRFGRISATDDEIIRAAQVANAHDFIMNLPQGYDTVIGERGVRLSGGQKQRLSIARAVLKDAPILILDEATSAVDSETEAQIQQAMERLMQGRTSIVIAHRLSTIRSADQIAVIEGGRVVERGHHTEMMQHGGLYARLVERQAEAMRP